jgi:hypothetical protein
MSNFKAIAVQETTTGLNIQSDKKGRKRPEHSLKRSRAKFKFYKDETSMIRLSQTLMKIHHASSIRPIKNKLFSDENFINKSRD